MANRVQHSSHGAAACFRALAMWLDCLTTARSSVYGNSQKMQLILCVETVDGLEGRDGKCKSRLAREVMKWIR